MSERFVKELTLSKPQINKLIKSEKDDKDISMRITASNLKGGEHRVFVSEAEVKRIVKAMKSNKGLTLKISKSDLHVMKGDGILDELKKLFVKAKPVVKKVAKTVGKEVAKEKGFSKAGTAVGTALGAKLGGPGGAVLGSQVGKQLGSQLEKELLKGDKKSKKKGKKKITKKERELNKTARKLKKALKEREEPDVADWPDEDDDQADWPDEDYMEGEGLSSLGGALKPLGKGLSSLGGALKSIGGGNRNSRPKISAPVGKLPDKEIRLVKAPRVPKVPKAPRGMPQMPQMPQMPDELVLEDIPVRPTKPRSLSQQIRDMEGNGLISLGRQRGRGVKAPKQRKMGALDTVYSSPSIQYGGCVHCGCR